MEADPYVSQGTGMRHHRTTAHTCAGLSDLGLVRHRSGAKGESVQQQQRWGAMEPWTGERCKRPGPIAAVAQAAATRVQQYQQQDPVGLAPGATWL